MPCFRSGIGIRILIGILAVSWIPAQIGVAAGANWQVTEGQDPLSGESRCLLESVEKRVDDGQTTTGMRIVYNGDAFVVVTDSNIDLSYPGVGMDVDGREAFSIDRLHGKTSVVFESDPEAIRSGFERGTDVRVALGFWPTWPQTNTVVTPFSLIGFTSAHRAFLECRSSSQ